MKFNYAIVFLTFLVSLVDAEPDQASPNIILIMADDLGYETIGANGGTSYQTPVLDQQNVPDADGFHLSFQQ